MEKKHPVLKLFLYIILLYVAWYVFYQFVLIPGGSFDFWLTRQVTSHSISLLNLLSVEHFSMFVNPYGKCSILRDNLKVISVNHACNGQVLYPVFISFIVVTGGHWLNKITMALLGSLVIYISNLIRVISLVYVKISYPQYLDFNHKYTFVILVYSVIFLLWVYWANMFSKYKIFNHASKKYTHKDPAQLDTRH
ncbi:MAG TPA: hypothetical protein VL947_10955 [Cytophagales bacterium]|nr:hypothetical protein [Cytophagales bacterium]